MPGSNLRPELVGRIDRRIHVAPQPLLRFGQCVGNALEWHIPDDEQVDVAGGPQLAAGRRAEHEGHGYPIGERRQRLPQHVGHTGRLEEQRLKLREDWRFAIRLEINLPSLDGTSEKPGAGEHAQFSLDGALPGARVADDLAQVVGLARMPQQPPQHAPPGAAEQLGRGFAFGCFRT